MACKIVEAISKDCTKLIQNFVAQNNSEFSSFCNEYKKIKFYHIYTIQLTDTDMILTTRHIMSYCKDYFHKTTITTVMEKIGALYLMYCIYYQQPQKLLVKIQVDMDTYVNLRKFIAMIDEKQNYDQVRYIFYHLLSVNAFRFVASEIFYGLEPFLYKEKGFCVAFKLLETKYNEMKSKINKKEKNEGNKIEYSNIAEQYEKQLEKIEKMLNTNTKDGEQSNQSENESSKKSMVVREIKKTAFSKNFSSFQKSILDGNSMEDSSSNSEQTTDDDLEPPKAVYLKRKYSAVKILNEKLPKEVLKELGDC
ncbi:uncharacterized protein LOC129609964 isoform X2 [Condylostylus longicornis]|uniref:uncharacterized protein LOC129609964 isoform X2 n=1 Tax=Condylostylus longicornis TaxID=2530218 RepID=UPI00244DBB0A|nr:uncharacterized protein LOC129609964 isoform X2 [Condylostylus longicornis]